MSSGCTCNDSHHVIATYNLSHYYYYYYYYYARLWLVIVVVPNAPIVSECLIKNQHVTSSAQSSCLLPLVDCFINHSLFKLNARSATVARSCSSAQKYINCHIIHIIIMQSYVCTWNRATVGKSLTMTTLPDTEYGS